MNDPEPSATSHDWGRLVLMIAIVAGSTLLAAVVVALTGSAGEQVPPASSTTPTSTTPSGESTTSSAPDQEGTPVTGNAVQGDAPLRCSQASNEEPSLVVFAEADTREQAGLLVLGAANGGRVAVRIAADLCGGGLDGDSDREYVVIGVYDTEAAACGALEEVYELVESRGSTDGGQTAPTGPSDSMPWKVAPLGEAQSWQEYCSQLVGAYSGGSGRSPSNAGSADDADEGGGVPDPSSATSETTTEE